MKTISIIMPVYNVSIYLKKSIESVLNQTFSEFELILIDDGSTDGSDIICNYYGHIDQRVKVIHKNNGGLSDARNKGLEIATGEYIGFIDSDDYIENDMYEKLLSACLKYESDMSVCGRYDNYEDKIGKKRFSFPGIQIWSNKKGIKNLLLSNNIDSAVWDKLFKREILKDIKFPLGRYNEDVFVMVKILSKCKKIIHIGASKYYYCHRPNSISGTRFSFKKMDLLDASEEVLNFILNEYPEFSLQGKCFYFNNVIYLLSLLKKSGENEYKKAELKLSLILNKYKINIIFNKYLSLKKKIIFILLISKTFKYYLFLKGVLYK